MEIMFDDLTPEAQQRLLKEACVIRPEDMDWDELPVAVVEFLDSDHEFKDDDYDDDYDDDDDDDNYPEDMYDEDYYE